MVEKIKIITQACFGINRLSKKVLRRIDEEPLLAIHSRVQIIKLDR